MRWNNFSNYKFNFQDWNTGLQILIYCLSHHITDLPTHNPYKGFMVKPVDLVFCREIEYTYQIMYVALEGNSFIQKKNIYSY